MRTVVEDLPGEEWRDVVGYEGAYQVSSLGRVMRMWGSTPEPKEGDDEKAMRASIARLPRYRSGLLKPSTDNHGGRMTVALCMLGRVRRLQVHRLVLLAFKGPAPEDKPVCRHLNGNHLDNRPDNLEWGTMQENADDAARHGTRAQGEMMPQSKLDEEAVRAIRASGAGQKELAEHYGVSQAAISQIRTRKTWKHVE